MPRVKGGYGNVDLLATTLCLVEKVQCPGRREHDRVKVPCIMLLLYSVYLFLQAPANTKRLRVPGTRMCVAFAFDRRIFSARLVSRCEGQSCSRKILRAQTDKPAGGQ